MANMYVTQPIPANGPNYIRLHGLNFHVPFTARQSVYAFLERDTSEMFDIGLKGIHECQ